jgi:mercuric ion transport protein
MGSTLNAKTALVGGVLASIGASVCCLGPLILLSLGIGGAWIGNLTALEPYRPIFILLVFLFVGLAFRKLYFTPSRCETDGSCAVERTQKVQRLLFWIVVPLMLLLVATPWLLPLFYR